MNNIRLWLAPILGIFRLLMSHEVIVLSSPISIAVASNLYILAGLYAIGYALARLKKLSAKQQELGNTLHLGVGVLFISRGIADLCQYLDLYDKFRILPTLLIQPLTGYPLFVEFVAANLPFFSLAILIVFTLHQLHSAPASERTSTASKLLSLLNSVFITVATLMCLTHAYILLGSLFSNYYYAAVVSPYSAIHISRLLNQLYDPLASATLLAPTFLGIKEEPTKGQTPPSTPQKNVDTLGQGH